jgi:nucleotidyltransferase/DNA polymerase involved in DNA repair
VDRADEERFLAPLSITMLPLPSLALQLLDWLGIRTLEQFAQLPASAVLQRFGRAGKIAQEWARGRDNRPVCATAKVAPEPISIDFDPPTALHPQVLQATLTALQPRLSLLADQLEGCRHLRLELKFDDNSSRVIDCAFVEPVTNGSRLRATLAHQLQALNWPSELATLRLTLLERGELVARQLKLFDTPRERASLDQLVQKLSHRHGAIFFQARLTDEQHPLAERRVTLSAYP